MDIEIRIEKPDDLDPGVTSALAREAFQKQGAELSTERFSWTYRQGYDRATLVSAFAEGRKVGQLGCFFKTFVVNGSRATAAELVDLFVSPDYRGFKVASSLYKEMKKVVTAEDARFMFAYANEGASVLNRRFFGMEEVMQLPARIGLANPLAGRSPGGAVAVYRDISQIAEACAGCAAGGPEGGVMLSAEQLRNRIGSPVHSYLCATDGNAAILASPRMIRSVPLLLICATFSRKPADKKAMAAMIASLCRAAGRSIFLYAGWNDACALRNGLPVPERLLKGKFLIQSNCLNSRRDGIGRFELLDVDYG